MLMPVIPLSAQLTSEKLKFIFNTGTITNSISYPKEVAAFYSLNDFQIYWLTKENTNLPVLVKYRNSLPVLGLNLQDYQPEVFDKYLHGFQYSTETDSLLAEIKFTDAAIRLLHEVQTGNRAPLLSYNGLHYTPSCYNIPAQLNLSLAGGKFAFLLDEIEPRQEAYLAVKNQLNLFLKNSSGKNFKDTVVTAAAVSKGNTALITRLQQLGFLNPDTAGLSAMQLKGAVKKAQQLFDLLDDGILRSTTIQALNIPLAVRIAALVNTLNTIRWLGCLMQSGNIIVVNIPSASLLLYELDKVKLESRIIVGKRSTPTPTLSSKVTEVILYPYWNVPYKITTRELLPKIKRNPGFLDANNYQVLNRMGKVVNPSAVNWRALGEGNFPYVIRQSTGCDNALGLIKLNFYNPFSVYLHDTPGKTLFALNKRYFSHGCMRVEKAMELGRFILKNNAIAIDTLTEKGCLKNQSPISVPAERVIPVMILYQTAWIDSTAQVRFYEDVYDKFTFKR